jgi:hypothetical protein
MKKRRHGKAPIAADMAVHTSSTYVESSAFRFMTEVTVHPCNATLRKLLDATEPRPIERRLGTHESTADKVGVSTARRLLPAITTSSRPTGSLTARGAPPTHRSVVAYPHLTPVPRPLGVSHTDASATSVTGGLVPFDAVHQAGTVALMSQPDASQPDVRVSQQLVTFRERAMLAHPLNELPLRFGPAPPRLTDAATPAQATAVIQWKRGRSNALDKMDGVNTTPPGATPVSSLSASQAVPFDQRREAASILSKAALAKIGGPPSRPAIEQSADTDVARRGTLAPVVAASTKQHSRSMAVVPKADLTRTGASGSPVVGPSTKASHVPVANSTASCKALGTAEIVDEADNFRQATLAKLSEVGAIALESLAMVEEARAFRAADDSLPTRRTYPHLHNLAAMREVPTDSEEARELLQRLGETDKVDENAPRWLRWTRALERPVDAIDAGDLLGTTRGLLPKRLVPAVPAGRRRSKRASISAIPVALRRKSIASSINSPNPVSLDGRRDSVTSLQSPADFSGAPLSPADSAFLGASSAMSNPLDRSERPRAVHVREDFASRALVTDGRDADIPSEGRPLLPPGRRVSVDMVQAGLVEPQRLEEANAQHGRDTATHFRSGAATTDVSNDVTLTQAQRKIALIKKQAAAETASASDLAAEELLRARFGQLFGADDVEAVVVDQLQAEADRYLTTVRNAPQLALKAVSAAEIDAHAARFEKGFMARRLMRNRDQVDQEDRTEIDWALWRRSANRALAIGMNEINTGSVAARMQVQWVSAPSNRALNGDVSESITSAQAASDVPSGSRTIPCYSARTLLGDNHGKAPVPKTSAKGSKGTLRHKT